jgi:uncharacterized protein with ATP-grasp and redox domains
MQAKPECTICSLKQVLTTAKKITDDEVLHKQVLDCAMTYLQDISPEMTPAEMAGAPGLKPLP